MAFYVYIVTNKRYGVLYTGMTDNIKNRAWKINLIEGLNPGRRDLAGELI